MNKRRIEKEEKDGERKEEADSPRGALSSALASEVRNPCQQQNFMRSWRGGRSDFSWGDEEKEGCRRERDVTATSEDLK